jgi:hypothetical protein
MDCNPYQPGSTHVQEHLHRHPRTGRRRPCGIVPRTRRRQPRGRRAKRLPQTSGRRSPSSSRQPRLESSPSACGPAVASSSAGATAVIPPLRRQRVRSLTAEPPVVAPRATRRWPFASARRGPELLSAAQRHIVGMATSRFRTMAAVDRVKFPGNASTPGYPRALKDPWDEASTDVREAAGSMGGLRLLAIMKTDIGSSTPRPSADTAERSRCTGLQITRASASTRHPNTGAVPARLPHGVVA